MRRLFIQIAVTEQIAEDGNISSHFAAGTQEWLHDDGALVIDLAERAENLRPRHPALARRTSIGFTDVIMAEPVASFENGAADAVFLDIEMPGLNGFDMLAQLRQQPLIVFATAYDEYAIRAFDTNAIDYLLKPIQPARLSQAIGATTAGGSGSGGASSDRSCPARRSCSSAIPGRAA